MKQTIPFKKDITFKTKIGELTAISLDNDLTLKGEDLIVGNFYISGNYKMLEGSIEEETYSYKIPCEIAISSEYDTYNATIDIDDFYYEIINDEVLRVNIAVVISNLERKEEDEPLIKEEPSLEELPEEQERNSIPQEEPNIKLPLEEEFEEITELPRNTTNIQENKSKEQNYTTYKVYIYKEEDTIESILEKYKISKEELSNYNTLEDIIPGSKIVIPSSND